MNESNYDEAVVDCWDTAICRAATPCHRAGSSAGASIINGGGEYVSLAEIFLRKLLRFCLSRLAIGSQNRTASGENSRCNKKAHPAIRQDARKIACEYLQANGINLVHFALKSPVFAILYRSYDIKLVDGLHRGDTFRNLLTTLRDASQSRFYLHSRYS